MNLHTWATVVKMGDENVSSALRRGKATNNFVNVGKDTEKKIFQRPQIL